MPISALPPETVRLLGSPVVYTSPVSFVKELVDNAIDARATSIEILVSPNTLDSIEVRDNGHGISPQDFGSIGRRGHTSKLRKFEDLQIVGPLTLGFRGDALACAAVMSTVTITTRTAGEPTASKLYLSARGGVEKTERVAGPVGTAVKAVNIFSRTPVRKQFALKEAAKTITKIRELQHTYFFARPYMKLTYRILGHPRVWSCAPGPHPSLREVTLQIFGSDLVSQCVAKTYLAAAETRLPVTQSDVSKNDLEKSQYVIEAFLPKPGADPVKISKWAFMSVDSRPVSFSKGAMRTLYSTFKARLSRNLEGLGINVTPKQPFLALNIKCPPGTYDPNIEPSKDEVLFANAQHLVTAFEHFLNKVYPAAQPASNVVGDEDGPDQASRLPSPPASDERPPLSTRNRPPAMPGSPVPQRAAKLPPMIMEVGEKLVDESLRITTSVAVQPGVSGSLGDDCARSNGENPRELGDPSQPGGMAPIVLERQKSAQATPLQSPGQWSETTGQTGRNISDRLGPIMTPRHTKQQPTFSVDMSEEAERISKLRPAKPGPDVNPWAIAKRSSRHRPTEAEEEQQPALVAQSIHDEQPQASFEEARLAMLARLANLSDADQDLEAHRMQVPVPAAAGSSRVPGGPFLSSMLNNGIHSPMPASTVTRQLRNSGRPHCSLGSFAHEGDSSQASTSHQGRLPKRPRPNQGLVQATLDFGSRTYRKPRRKDVANDGDNNPLSHIRQSVAQEDMEEGSRPDLSAIRRRQTMAENQRMSDQQEETDHIPAQTILRQPPRYGSNPSAASGPSSSVNIPPQKTALEAGDPRAHLMKTGCSMPARTPRKLTRSKSSIWPLESVPAGFELHCLVQHITIDANSLIPSLECMGDYGLHGSGLGTEDAFSDSISKADFEVIQQRVTKLLLQLGFDTTNGECEIEFISASKMLGKSAA